MAMFRTISRDLRRQASEDAADLLDAILKTNTDDDRELATELGWSRKKIRNVRTVLSSYIKHRAKNIPALQRLMRIRGEAAEHLCEKYAVLKLLLSGSFIPARRSKSLASIYEKFESFDA
jgi:aminoglycoside phosphotransferase (APT) family kinase protein